MDTPILVELHSTLSLRQKLWLLCKIYFRKFLNLISLLLNACGDLYEWIYNTIITDLPKVTTTLSKEEVAWRQKWWRPQLATADPANRAEVAEATRSGNLILDRDDYQTVVYCGKCNYSFATTGTHICGKCGLPGTIDYYIGSEGDTYIDMPIPTPDNQHLFQNSFRVSCNYYVGPMPMASYYITTSRQLRQQQSADMDYLYSLKDVLDAQ